MADLAVDTAVHPLGADRFTAELSPDWEIWGPNGGYLAGVALRAAAAASAQPCPASISCHFLAVASFDPVRLEVETLRTSRRAESLRVTMWQEETRVVEALVWLVTQSDGLVHDADEPPEVDDPHRVPTMQERLGPDAPSVPFPFWRNLESRPLDWVDPAERRPSEPRVRNWYRYVPRATFEDDPVVDAIRTLILLDTMSWPSAVRAHPPGELGFVAPTLDVNVQFHRAAPTSDWLLVEATSPVGADGLIGYTSKVWSQGRVLLGSASGQMRCRPTGRR